MTGAGEGLCVFVSGHCAPCAAALALVERLRRAHPEVPVSVVDVDAPGAVVPGAVIGTPVYLWGDRVLFLGNPSDAELAAALDRARAGQRVKESA